MKRQKKNEPSWTQYVGRATSLLDDINSTTNSKIKIELICRYFEEVAKEITGEELDAKANGGCDW